MATWYTAAQKIATGHIRHELQYPLREVVRADGKFPYRPGIVSGPHLRISRGDQAFAHALVCHRQVCPRPERKYEAQIGLENMERQAARAPPVPHDTMAKWGFEALASRAQSHFAHLRSPFAVADCALCRSSTVGCAILDWVLTVASTNPTAPHRITWSTSTPTFRTPGCPGDSPLENIAEVSLESSPALVGSALESSPPPRSHPIQAQGATCAHKW